MGILSSLFSSGIVKSVEKLASEYIQTDLESAEAKALMIKTLDPNGLMRRDLSRFACWAYGFYLVAMVGLSFMVAFGIGNVVGASEAATMMTGLFLPITTSWAAIVSASFGVNAANAIKLR